jgi:RNA polymerase sigma factor (sigma-70 family)
MAEVATTSEIERSDSDLLRDFVESRQEHSFGEIVDRHGSMVVGVCRSVLGNTSDAEDAAQAVFLTLARRASEERGRQSLAGWLHKVAWFVAQRAVEARQIRRRHEKEAGRMRAEHSLADEGSPSLEKLHAGLAELPDKYRVAMLLHHIEGRSQEETAALLGCGVSAVAMRLNRGRKMLRERLSRRGENAAESILAAASDAERSNTAAPAFVALTTKAAVAAITGKLSAGSTVTTVTWALSSRAVDMLFWAKIKTVAAILGIMVVMGGSAGVYKVIATPPRNGSLAASPLPQTGKIIGVITRMTDGTITLEVKDQSQPVSFEVNESTVVKVNGHPAHSSDLKVGMRAIAFVNQGTPATEIRAYHINPAATRPAAQNPSQNKVYGAVTVVDANSMTLDNNGKSVIVAFTAATVFKIQGKPAEASDLSVGMRAIAFLTSEASPTAIEIRAYHPPASENHPTPK